MPVFERFSIPGWRGEILSELAPRAAETLASVSAEGEILKEGGARRMWSVDVGGRPAVVKEYLYPRSADRIAAALRGSRAAREWRRLRSLWERKGPVPGPILWAESTEGERRSLLAMERVEAEPLSDLLDRLREMAAEERFALGRAVGESLAKFHAAGGIHGDAHPGNLMAGSRDGKACVWVIDLHQVGLRRSTSWNERLWNLAAFLKGQADRISIGDRHRILGAYLATVTDYSPPFPNAAEARRSMARAVSEFERRIHARWWKARIAKCEEHGKRFHRLRAGEFEGWVRAEWDSPEFRGLLANPESMMSDEAALLVKEGDTTTVARVFSPARPEPLMLKGYNRKDWWERTKNLFRRSRAMKVWRAGYALEILEIPTPKVVCVLEKRSGPFLLESFILTEWEEGGVGYDEFYRSRYGEPPLSAEREREKRAVEQAVARLFARLHKHRISHGDLKGRNVLVQPDRPIPFQPQFVDLDAMSLRPIRFRRSRVNDLARLLFSLYPLVSPRCAWRFLRDYSVYDAEVWRKRKWWWKAVGRRTERKLREKGVRPDLSRPGR